MIKYFSLNEAIEKIINASVSIKLSSREYRLAKKTGKVNKNFNGLRIILPADLKIGFNLNDTFGVEENDDLIEANAIKDKFLQDGDILIARKSYGKILVEVLENIGDKKVIPSTDVTAIRINKDLVEPHYIKAFMKSNKFLKQFNNLTRYQKDDIGTKFFTEAILKSIFIEDVKDKEKIIKDQKENEKEFLDIQKEKELIFSKIGSSFDDVFNRKGV